MHGIPGDVLLPRPNVYRLVLHPRGLNARLANAAKVHALFLERLTRQAAATGDPELRALYDEVTRYPVPADQDSGAHAESGPFQVPVRIRTPAGELAMFSVMATFGAPADVTLSELAIELFYPLDEFTAAALRELASGGQGQVPNAEQVGGARDVLDDAGGVGLDGAGAPGGQ
ncbi:MmyB family transcriptional regulator [Nocardia sp. NPDC055321]